MRTEGASNERGNVTMLHLYMYGPGSKPENVTPYGMEIVNDIEMEFENGKVEVTETAKLLVEDIDEGKLIDGSTFINKIGWETSIENLSTGAKAGLLVERSAKTHKVINLIECGKNAIVSIILNCRDGYATLLDPMYELDLYSIEREVSLDAPIDVLIEDGAHLRTVDEYNDYIRNYRGLGQYGVQREKWIQEQALLRQQNEKK